MTSPLTSQMLFSKLQFLLIPAYISPMNKYTFLPLFYLAIALFSCKNTDSVANPKITDLSVLCKYGGEPNLQVTSSGKALLSWVEYLNDTTDALVFSRLEDGRWGPPKTIATGSNWFVNWADFPSLTAYADDEKSLAAHWLQMSAKGTYDYDVRVAQSADGGKTWGESFILHKDSVPAEHGFVSMMPLPDGRIFASWLDGRFTKTDKAESHENGHEHGHGGPMTLRCAVFDKTGQLTEEAELDNRVCDCCQTAAAFTSNGPIVAYRDRSEEEYRDIYYVRWLDKGMWSPPAPVFKDKWHTTSCPVNGPAIAAMDKTVAIAWFTAANEKPEVKIAFSKDAGDTFDTPIHLDNGKPEGRVDVILLSKDKAMVVWLENVEGDAEIRAIEVPSEGKLGEPILIAKTDASRQSGFPRIERVGDKVLFAWTEVVGEETRVRSAWMVYQ